MLLRLFLLSTILISSAHPLLGQVRDGNFTGTINDPSGAALNGASLELLNGATGVRFSTQSSDAGVYRFTNVLPGRYQLTATLAGFQTPDLAKKLGHEADYFATNVARMNYPKFRKQHLFIGSEVIEAACKTVVGHRLKQSGIFCTAGKGRQLHPRSPLLSPQRSLRGLLGGSPGCLSHTPFCGGAHPRLEPDAQSQPLDLRGVDGGVHF